MHILQVGHLTRMMYYYRQLQHHLPSDPHLHSTDNAGPHARLARTPDQYTRAPLCFANGIVWRSRAPSFCPIANVQLA